MTQGLKDVSNSTLASGRLTIDLNALSDNWTKLNDLAGKAECGASVKANAYGIGIKHAIPTLDKAGCKNYFVATPQEATDIRQISEKSNIYVLNGLMPGCADAYIQNNLRPVLNSLEEAQEWAKFGNGSQCALHVDTGMNRLGLREEEAKGLAQNTDIVRSLNLSLLMTHLACGDTPTSLMNGCQLSSFQDIAALFPNVPRSLCNSAGIFHGEGFHMELVRPGIALYGGAALTKHVANNPLKPVVTAEARILVVRDVKEHESVGYGASEVVAKDTRIAIVSAGYADGLVRKAGSTTKQKGGEVFVHGQQVPLVGRVSMDMIAIDVTDVPNAKRGDYVELFGPNNSISKLAGSADTIDYEFLTGLGARYERRYIEA